MNKLAIIDPVGMKAGMNCYDLGLLHALQKKGVKTFAFSNFKDDNFPAVAQYPLFLKEKKGTVENTINFVSAHIKALSICRKEKIQWAVLHVFSTTAKDILSFYLTRIFGIKIIAIIHDVSSLSNEDNTSFRNKMYAMAHFLVLHNQTSYHEISKILDDKSKQKLKIIPHGNYIDFVDENNRIEYFKNTISFSTSYKYLLFFGQIKKVKGLDVLLKAAPLLPPEFKIIIAGRPHRDDFEYYENMINELSISEKVIKCIRFITDEERNYLFQHCDALILPYRKIFQSGVLLLAMSYGLPVIASDLPANKEIITDGENGFLFEDGDSADLTNKVIALFRNNGIENIKLKTKQTAAEEFGWMQIAESYKHLID